MSEHDEQAALFEWAAMQEARYPELKMLHANPNGGHRHKRTAARLKAEGVKAGVFDIYLMVPAGNYHGLAIEMKFGRNSLTNNQKRWGERYLKYGYDVAVFRDWQKAAEKIIKYIKLHREGRSDAN